MLVGGDQITITQHNNPPETMIILIAIHDVCNTIKSCRVNHVMVLTIRNCTALRALQTRLLLCT